LIRQLETKREDLLKKKEDEEKKAKDEIQEIVEQNAKSIKEQREKQKEVLRFLKSIGFDLIPKEVTDYVIARIKE